jgi:hypothetical protein
MSAMEQMLAGMLKNALPAEVMELLSPEKLQEFGERINAYITDNKNGIEQILTNQDAILNRLTLIEERLDNVGRGNNSGSAKRGNGTGGAGTNAS